MSKLTFCLFASLLISVAAHAQNQFVLRVEQGGNIAQIQNGATVAVNSPAPGVPRTAQLLVTYTGGTSVTFPQGPVVFGSRDFTARLVSGGTLTPFQTATVEVVFTPTSSSTALAQLDLGYTEAPVPPTDPNTPVAQPTRGLLTVGFSGGVPVYSLTYAVGSSGNTLTVAPNGELSFPATLTNSSTTASVNVVNRGSSAGQVNTVTVSGAAFSIASLAALPAALNVSASLPFQLIYLPRRMGSDEGALTIGFEGGLTQTYVLRGTGFASQLSYEVIQSDGSTAPVEPGQPIQLPSTFLGHRGKVQLRYTNATGADVTVANAVSSGPPFTVADLPPASSPLPPGASVTFTTLFEPTQAGRSNGILRIGNDSFPLAGEALGLPDYSINGPSTVGPMEQPAVSLAIGQAYPVAVNGTLVLGVASDYAIDPSVQFSTGGRTVSFTIPANSTRAVFPNGTNEIRLQTGSVAGSFTLTPTFATQAGLDLTPQQARVLRFSMAPVAPRLLGIQVAERGTTSLTLRILGYTTTRSLGKMDLRFAPASGFNIPNVNVTLDLVGPSTRWFNLSSSQASGGQFSVDVQFLLATSDSSANAAAPTQALQSVSVVLSNASGDSNSLSLNLR